jgi:hypothetical protein
MNWLKVITGVLVLWSGTAWGATLTWTADSASDLAGYRVYHCSLQPCTRTSGTASLLAVLGKVTSFYIGTPAVTQYYFITAYDLANNESGASNLATYLPAGATVSLTVVGDPATGKWGVKGSTTNTQDVMAVIRLDGANYSVQNVAPYCFPSDNGTECSTWLFGKGSHTVQFIFYLQSTTTEVGRASVTVYEGT